MGPGLSAGFGLALPDNVAIEISIGLLLGLVIGITRQKGKGLVIYFLLKSVTCKRSQEYICDNKSSKHSRYWASLFFLSIRVRQ